MFFNPPKASAIFLETICLIMINICYLPARGKVWLLMCVNKLKQQPGVK